MPLNLKITATAILAIIVFASFGKADISPTAGTNDVAFHLQSLGRTPSIEERQIIEAAFRLMKTHHFQARYPLKDLKHDAVKMEWVLSFNGSRPEANVYITHRSFLFFIQNTNANYFEVRWAAKASRTRYPQSEKTE